MNANYLLLVMLFICEFSFSQNTTITLQPNEEQSKDAYISSLNNTTNYGGLKDLKARSWIFEEEPSNSRGLVAFDLSAIPEDVEIIFAKLTLSPFIDEGEEALAGTNAITINRVTQDWSEGEVTWNNQPETDNLYQVEIGASSEAISYKDIDVTDLINDQYDNPSGNFGMLIRLMEEEQYRSAAFASSDHANENMRPKLVITYSSNPYQIDDCHGFGITVNQILTSPVAPGAMSYTYVLNDGTGDFTFTTNTNSCTIADFISLGANIQANTSYQISAGYTTSSGLILSESSCPITTAPNESRVCNTTSSQLVSMDQNIEAISVFNEALLYKFNLYDINGNFLDSYSAPMSNPPNKSFQFVDFINVTVQFTPILYSVKVQVSYDGISFEPEGSTSCLFHVVDSIYSCGMPDTPCNMIGNGGFENYDSNLPSGSGTHFTTNKVNCWFAAKCTPEISNSVSFSGSNSALLVASNPEEGVVQQFHPDNIPAPGRHYVLSYNVRTEKPSNPNQYDISAHLTDNTVSGFPATSCSQSLPSVQLLLDHQHSLTNTNWKTYQSCTEIPIQMPNLNQIYFYADNGISSNGSGVRSYLDEVELVPLVNAGPDIACGGRIGTKCFPSTFTNGTLTHTVTYNWSLIGGGTPPPGTFTSTTSARPCATPPTTTTYKVTVTYTITDNTNTIATFTESDQVTVFNDAVQFVTPDPIICPSVSETIEILNPDPTTVYEWYSQPYIPCPSGSSTPFAYGNSITVLPNNTKTYYVRGVGEGVGFCDEITVTVDNDPMIITNTDSRTICFSNEVELCGSVGGHTINANWTGPTGLYNNQACILTSEEGVYEANGFSVNGCPVNRDYYVSPCCFDDNDPGMITADQSNIISVLQTVNAGDQVFVNGDVTFQSGTLHLEGIEMSVSPGAKITLTGPSSMYLKNVDILAACPDMWQGMELLDNVSLEVVDSRIYDAETAIHVNTNKVGLYVFNSTFQNNYNGIEFRYAIDQPLNVISIIDNDFNSIPSTMKLPHDGYYSHAHILLSYDDLKSSTWVIRKNDFLNARYGVLKPEPYSGGLGLTLDKNTFKDCYNAGIFLGYGAGNAGYLITEENTFYFPASIPLIYNGVFNTTYGAYVDHDYTSIDDKFYGACEPLINLNQIGIYHKERTDGNGLGDVAISNGYFENLQTGIRLINADFAGFPTTIQRNLFVNNRTSILFDDNMQFYGTYGNPGLSPHLLRVQCNDFIRDDGPNPDWKNVEMAAMEFNSSPTSVGLPTLGVPSSGTVTVSDTPRNEVLLNDGALFYSLKNNGIQPISYQTYGSQENFGSINLPITNQSVAVTFGSFQNPDQDDICAGTTAGSKLAIAQGDLENHGATQNEIGIDSAQGIKLNHMETAKVGQIVHIAPNPTRTGIFILNIESGFELNKVIQVYSAYGKLISKISTVNGEMLIDLSNFAKGMYFIQIDDGINKTVQKVIFE